MDENLDTFILNAYVKAAFSKRIELKNGKKGKLSEEQKRMIDYYKQQGCRVEVVRSFDEFVELVTDYMN